MVAERRFLDRTAAPRAGRERRQQGDQMSRNQIIGAGAILWAVVGLDVIVHLAAGDLLVPAALGIVGTSWVAIRRATRKLPEAA
jgi:hypothetical protein